MKTRASQLASHLLNSSYLLILNKDALCYSEEQFLQGKYPKSDQNILGQGQQILDKDQIQPSVKAILENSYVYSNYHTIVLIPHASKVMLKILQARLQQYMNRELPDVQAGFRKAEELELKLPTSTGSRKKQESSRKTSISAFLTMPKPLTVWITINSGKFFKRWEYQIT